ncbi:DeoR/GlpR family DNA-binding transcription regulator [Arthrobacter citreus]|uniref:DeoR/GlpR family DNA-binding transcription regulator n=1 Tax=Arthrobacter citreus TaxID=1670 RepID=A0ABZ2ZXH4_9MICC
MKPNRDEAAREHEILVELDTRGAVIVRDLADRFGISEVTVRKDLATMERRSLLRRVRGGAVPLELSDEGAFNMRLRSQRETKRLLARAVAPLVDHGDTIAIDSSTTCFYLAHELVDRRNLLVVTNGLRVATLFMERSNAMVVMPGGTVRRSSGSLVGPVEDALSGRGRISKGFFGVKSISLEYGLAELALEEANAKRHLANACTSVYALFSSVKAGQLGLHPFVAPARITAMYTDERISGTFVSDWERRNVPVHTVATQQRPGLEAAG